MLPEEMSPNIQTETNAANTLIVKTSEWTGENEALLSIFICVNTLVRLQGQGSRAILHEHICTFVQ